MTTTKHTEKMIGKVETLVTSILTAGNSAQKLYIMLRTDGSVDAREEVSYSVSESEYFGRTPHDLSLELQKSTRDYSALSAEEIEEQAMYAADAAHEFAEEHRPEIAAWVEAGNLETVNAA